MKSALVSVGLHDSEQDELGFAGIESYVGYGFGMRGCD